MKKEPANNHLQLELHVPDFAPVREYYSAMEFEEVDRQPPDPEYLIMRLDANVLRFWPGTEKASSHLYFQRYPADTPRGYGVEIILMVDDLDDYYERVKAVAKVVEPLILRPWGLKDFRTVDPFGYYLRFTSPHNVLGNAHAISKRNT